MEKGKKLTDYQMEILSAIVNDSIKAISYRNPKKNLGEIVEGKSRDETLEALGSLEKEFGIVVLDPSLKFGIFNRCGYRVVDLDKTKQLYDSHAKEE